MAQNAMNKIHLITAADVNEYRGPYGGTRYSVDASTLGYKPGEVPPTRIPTTIGNAKEFIMCERIDGHGWRYMQRGTAISLVIWND